MKTLSSSFTGCTRPFKRRLVLLSLGMFLAALPGVQAQTDAQELTLNGGGSSNAGSGSTTGNAGTITNAGSISAGSINVTSAGTLTLNGNYAFTGSTTVNANNFFTASNTGALSLVNLQGGTTLTATAQQGQPFRYQVTPSVTLSNLALSPSSSLTFVSSTGSNLTFANAGQYSGLQVNPLTGQLLISSSTPYILVGDATLPAGSVTLPATGSGTIASPAKVTFTATNLPAGLTLDAATGLITGVPTQAGTSNVTLSTVSASGTATPRTLFLTVAPIPPTATLTAAHPKVTVGSGDTGVFTVTLSAAQTSDVYVRYTIKGSAVNGTDFMTLSGVKKIKAGKTTRSIHIIPKGDWSPAERRVVKLTLEPGTGYTVGTSSFVKLVMLSGE